MKGWTKKLTKSELRHIRQEAGCNSFAAVKRTLAWQAEKRRDDPDGIEICWTCRGIAEKLGLPIN